MTGRRSRVVRGSSLLLSAIQKLSVMLKLTFDFAKGDVSLELDGITGTTKFKGCLKGNTLKHWI